MSPQEKAKHVLRREIRQRLARLSATEMAVASQSLRKQLTFPPRSRVALFAGTSREPMLLDLIARSPEVSWFLPKVTGPGTMSFLPVSHLGNLRPGAFDIPEPSAGPEAESLDVIVCPGLAFTLAGHRLGQGGGFYDRALAQFPEARTMGVAFPCQIVASLPCEEHDRTMDQVLIPSPESRDEIPGC